MAYFPLFIDLNQKQGLVVGGGPVAARKIRTLLPYGPHLTVCAPSVLPELEALPGLTLRREPFSPAFLEDAFFVIAATDDQELNSRIARLCRERNIPVNVADPGTESTFLFPSVVRRGPLTVGISTGGKSPSAAHYLKEQIEGLLPDNLEAILLWMDAAREELKGSALSQPQRSTCLSRLFSAALQAGGPLSREETQSLLSFETEELP
ncbi:precorrin-2 dehydrogenase/sirohydrochlorin ferrochelatase family protein [Flintibacter sp.]|uniref:precorrin-2 dehydrogenase/sirohydrochlorin ferrochelatase family protein n=1 Tax=Flintibacter sp. TaxID=1918624 RepID=UPI003D0A9050|nr:bifunctional precorrin-2 dehydrogenase/sirohydrochlorin ferrochelatase [Flintibacter sp.]